MLNHFDLLLFCNILKYNEFLKFKPELVFEIV